MEKINSNRERKIIIRNILTATGICVLEMVLFDLILKFLSLGSITRLDINYIALILTWSMLLLLVFSPISLLIVYVLLFVIGKELKDISYPWNVLIVVAGGTVLMAIFMFLLLTLPSIYFY